MYRRPMAAFLLPHPPQEPKAPADFRAGVARTRLGRDVRLSIRRAQRVQAVASELFEALDIVPALPPISTEGQADSAGAAAAVRKRLAVTVAHQAQWRDSYEALRAWREALGSMGVIVLQNTLPLDEIRGFSLAHSRPQTIVLNSSDFVTARIFTLFHELAHTMIGSGGLCLPEPQLSRRSGTPPEEVFCNDFAGNLLVPSGDLRSDRNAIQISKLGEPPSDTKLAPLSGRFKVSQQVIWYRLRQVDLITQDVYRQKWAIWANRPYQSPHRTSDRAPLISAARRSISENGRPFVSTVLQALDRGLVGVADVVDWLEIRATDLGKVEKLLSNSAS
jgi:Zn-dependent peptidase ImmA (M78 family)